MLPHLNGLENTVVKIFGFVLCAGFTHGDPARPLLKLKRAHEMHMDHKIYNVLLGDSSPEKIEVFQRALCCCPSFGLAHAVATICGVVSYLAGSGNFVDKDCFPRPDLVLLDLNLSGRHSGFEVLKWIQSQPMRRYRVVLFAGAAEDWECEEAYGLGADGFVARPESVPEMIKVLTRIEGWLKTSLTEEDPLEFCVS
jgi:CheY-like chemotaxis protein